MEEKPYEIGLQICEKGSEIDIIINDDYAGGLEIACDKNLQYIKDQEKPDVRALYKDKEGNKYHVIYGSTIQLKVMVESKSRENLHKIYSKLENITKDMGIKPGITKAIEGFAKTFIEKFRKISYKTIKEEINDSIHESHKRLYNMDYYDSTFKTKKDARKFYRKKRLCETIFLKVAVEVGNYKAAKHHIDHIILCSIKLGNRTQRLRQIPQKLKLKKELADYYKYSLEVELLRLREDRRDKLKPIFQEIQKSRPKAFLTTKDRKYLSYANEARNKMSEILDTHLFSLMQTGENSPETIRSIKKYANLLGFTQEKFDAILQASGIKEQIDIKKFK